VLSSLPPDAPAWIRTSGLFDRPRFPTGTLRPSGGAGSVLLRAETVRRAGRGFDPAFGLCGGEDTEYFSHLGRSGARMVWCDEAVAWEAVTKDRATLGWLLRRNYNSGRVYSRIALPRQTPLGRAAALARCALGTLVLCLVTPLALLAGRHVAARLFMRLARGLGRLSAGVGCLKPARSGS
jgi:succinoglycan biosynthesis protein ExoM